MKRNMSSATHTTERSAWMKADTSTASRPRNSTSRTMRITRMSRRMMTLPALSQPRCSWRIVASDDAATITKSKTFQWSLKNMRR